MEWLDATQRFYSLVVGLLGILASLIRVAFLLGKILESFSHHVKESDKRFAEHDERLQYLERRGRK